MNLIHILTWQGSLTHITDIPNDESPAWTCISIIKFHQFIIKLGTHGSFWKKKNKQTKKNKTNKQTTSPTAEAKKKTKQNKTKKKTNSLTWEIIIIIKSLPKQQRKKFNPTPKSSGEMVIFEEKNFTHHWD